MKVSLAGVSASEIDADALAVPVAPGKALSGPGLDVDRLLKGALSEMLTGGEFAGELYELLPVPTRGEIRPRRVFLYGVGPSAELDGQRLRWAHQAMVAGARLRHYSRLAVLCTDPLGPDDLKGVVEGCALGNFERRSRQTGPERRIREVADLTLVGFGPGRDREAAAALENGEATNRARAWQNAPPNELTPEVLAQEAVRIAERHRMEIEVLGPPELAARGYLLLLGVAAGSAKPPRLITLRHRGAPRPGAGASAGSPVLALIGKGITFDTGGISLKPADKMSLMKADMAGAAAVLSAIDVVAARRMPLDVLAVVAATENMPGSTAQRPGDVLLSATGKTVEIVNTDAEGRLVLADAVTHAIRHGATHMIDLATLTGAATIAVGHAATAAVSNNDDFWASVESAATAAGERVWRLPMLPDYSVLLRSKIADLRNSEYGEAGMIMGGMFIAQFVQDRPWAHLDIAASSWNGNEDLTTMPEGPNGTGTRICIELAERMAAVVR